VTDCPLTRTERIVLAKLAQGMTPREIAVSRERAPGTVQIQIWRLCRKLGLATQTEAIALATREGWLEGVEDREITRAQEEYLARFDQYLRAPSHHATEQQRERMVDQLQVVLEEAGVDPTSVTSTHYREVA
jgi:DNA-binding CsgD family transcriptional regulator